MKLNKHYIIIIALFTCSLGVAQQLPQFTQYMFNTISINPAYAGSREALSIVGLHRSQWVGFDGGPTTQTLSIHTPLRNDKMGLGLSFINDASGAINYSYIYGDFSYSVKTSTNTKLAFGLKAGATSYNFDSKLTSDPTVVNDPYFRGYTDVWTPNIGAGIFWHSNKWYLGLSAPRISNSDYNENDAYEALERVSYYFTGGFVFTLNKNLKFKPAYLIKATNGAPLSYDATANFLFNDKLWLGASYRINESAGAYGALIDYQVSRQLRVGYAYEKPNSDLNKYTNGTHEILLIYEFKYLKNKLKSPRYF